MPTQPPDPVQRADSFRSRAHSLVSRAYESAKTLWARPMAAAAMQLLAVLVFFLIIHWRLIENTSNCVSWVNYALPCGQDQYVAWTRWNPLLAAWQPLSGMGAPTLLPFSSDLERLTYWYPAAGLSTVLGPPQAAAWFAVIATLFLGAAFILWAGTVVRDLWGRFGALLLLIAGPFQLQLYGNGDYGLFVAEAFVFLSIYLLYRAIHDVPRRWLFYPSSLTCLIVSLAQVQIFFLGGLLYAAFLVVYVVPLGEGSLRHRLRTLGGLVLRFLTFPLLLAPFLLPTLFSPPFGLGPSSAYANPLLIFSHYSATPLSVFLMLGYLWTPGSALTNYTGYAMVASAAGPTMASVWTGISIAVVVFVWSGVLWFRDRRGVWLLAIAVLATLFGSGTQGPLGPLNTYLYLHLPGYQEVNASYFWDWMVVVPATALALGVLIERIREAPKSGDPVPETPGGSTLPGTAQRLMRLLRNGPRLRPTARRLMAVGLTVIVATSVVLPYAVNAQYGPAGGGAVGIQTIAYPSDYASIPRTLNQLIGSSYAGVAVFNPARAWYLYNSTHAVTNYFYFFPTAREPIVPSYNTAPVASNYYSYWAYEELYSNSSRYVGELLALSGIGYFLVFYGTQPVPSYLFASYDGTNVSHLLAYQHGISRVVSSRNYAIYRDLYFTSAAVSLSNLSLVAGGYSELDAMAYAGLNLSDQGVVLGTDLSPATCGPYLENVSYVYAASNNALEGPALACTARSSSSPAESVKGDPTVYEGWASSFSSEGGALGEPIIDAWPSALVASNGAGHTLSVPVEVGSCLSCRLWVLVRFSSDGSSLKFQWGTATWSVATNRSWSGTSNAMVWVQLPFRPGTGPGTLVVTSGPRWNALGTVVVAEPATVASWLANLTATKPIVLVQPGATLSPPIATGPGQAWYYCPLRTVDAFERSSLCFQAMGSEPLDLNITLPVRERGTLSLLVRSTSFADLELASRPGPLFGFDTTDSNLSTFRMGWIRLPVAPNDLDPNGNLSLRLLSGVVFLSEVVFTPDSVYGPLAPASSVPLLTSPSLDPSPLISGLNFSLTSVGTGQQQITGNLHFQSPGNNYYLGQVVMNRTSSVRYDVAVAYNVSPDLVVKLDGIPMSGNGTEGPIQVGAAMYSLAIGPDWTHSSLQFFTVGSNASASVHATFEITVEYGTIQLDSRLSDVGPPGAWTIAPNANGYRLNGGAASMVLVRVPYYPILKVDTGGFEIGPAVGSVDSILTGTGNATSITVSTTTGTYLVLGYEILGATVAAWMIVEYLWSRRSAARRSHRPGEGSPEAERARPREEPAPDPP